MDQLSALIPNLQDMSKEELDKRLEDIRAGRRTGYAPPKRKSKTKQVLPILQGIDEDAAAKILEELLKGMEETGE